MSILAAILFAVLQLGLVLAVDAIALPGLLELLLSGWRE